MARKVHFDVTLDPLYDSEKLLSLLLKEREDRRKTEEEAMKVIVKYKADYDECLSEKQKVIESQAASLLSLKLTVDQLEEEKKKLVTQLKSNELTYNMLQAKIKILEKSNIELRLRSEERQQYTATCLSNERKYLNKLQMIHEDLESEYMNDEG